MNKAALFETPVPLRDGLGVPDIGVLIYEAPVS
jgi:hypothetical protein